MKDIVLKNELSTFEKNKRNLIRNHLGEYVLIKDDEILGTYQSFNEAANKGIMKFGTNPFLVKKIEKEESKLVISLISRK